MTEQRASDERNPGPCASHRAETLTGWVVFRPKPWDFVGVFGSREEAELECERAGTAYQVAFGTADAASGTLDAPSERS